MAQVEAITPVGEPRMPIEVTMPRLSDTMEQGSVVKWNVKEGDSVSVGDVVADIETDKATMELQAFDDGTVAKVAVAEGETVAVGSVIMILAEEGEDPEEAAASAGTQKEAGGEAESKGEEKNGRQQAEGGEEKDEKADASTATAVAEPGGNGAAGGAPRDEPGPGGGGGDGEGGRIFASPLARKMAEDAGLDLRRIDGSGPSGRIVKKDVEAALEGRPARREAPAEEREAPIARVPAPEVGAPLAAPEKGPALEHQTIPLSNMRGTIARRLVESKTSIPHYQVTVEAEMDELMELREQLNEQLESQRVKLTVNDFLVRACALAMHRHPFINSRWVEKTEQGSPGIEIMGEVNVGVAIALPIERGGGLVVATLRNADAMGLRQISGETRRLAKKAREKGLTIEEMEDSTFTISNLGMFGVEHFTAIINPPNTAILAVGAAHQKPVVKDGEIVPGWRMQMTMSSDHRVIDGAMAAQYLATVKELLEKPATLLV